MKKSGRVFRLLRWRRLQNAVIYDEKGSRRACAGGPFLYGDYFCNSNSFGAPRTMNTVPITVMTVSGNM